MPAAPIGASERFIPDGETRVYLVDAIADTASPTREELDAGVDVSPELAMMTGWQARAVTISERAVGELFATQRPAWLEMQQGPSISLYADLAGQDIRQLLARGDQTHVVILHGGDVEGHLMDVWPVTVAAMPREVTVGGSPARIDVDFTVDRQPALDVPVPAHEEES